MANFLRIQTPAKPKSLVGAPTPAPGAAAPAPAPAAPTPGAASQAIERIVKLIPAEVMALYALGAPFGLYTTPFWIIGCAVFCVIFRAWGTHRDSRPQWGAVLISTVSFVLWQAVSQGADGHGYLAGFDLGFPPMYTFGATLLWTAIVPIFYSGETV